MHTLYLLRHAKSSWDEPSLADRDRPLAPRGRKAAKLVRVHLEEHGVRPDAVLCSPAARTRETLAAIEPALGRARVELEDGLYGAGASELLRRLRRLPDEVASVMVIGHNPGLEELATMLARSGERLAELEEKFPTGALATLAVPCPWSELGPRTARLADFVVPRRLG